MSKHKYMLYLWANTELNDAKIQFTDELAFLYNFLTTLTSYENCWTFQQS